MIKILDMENQTTIPPCLVDLGEQGLKITISRKGKQGYFKIYSALLVSLEAQPKLSGWFQNLHELAQYIKQQDRLQIDQDKKILKILMKVNLNKNKIVTLAQIVLNQMKKDYSLQIAQIMSRCNNQDRLSQNQVKTMFKRFSQIIHQLVICKQEAVKNKKQAEINSEQLKKKWEQKQLSEKLRKVWNQQSGQIYLELNKKFSELRMEIQIEKKSLQRFIHQKIAQTQAYPFYSNSNLYKSISQNVLLNQNFNKIAHRNEQKPIKTHKTQQASLIYPIDAQINILDSKSEKKYKSNRKKSTQNLHDHHNQSHQISFKSSIPVLNFAERKAEKITAMQWVDRSCYCYKNLQFKSNKIISKDPSNIFGITRIRGVFSFSFNLQKIHRGIALGLIDSNYKTKISLDNEPNWVVYWSDGECWDGSRQKNYGRGYHQAQVVNMVGDLNEGTMEWKVNSDIRCKIKCQRLKDKNIKWVPYICLWDKGDRVIIV